MPHHVIRLRGGWRQVDQSGSAHRTPHSATEIALQRRFHWVSELPNNTRLILFAESIGQAVRAELNDQALSDTKLCRDGDRWDITSMVRASNLLTLWYSQSPEDDPQLKLVVSDEWDLSLG